MKCFVISLARRPDRLKQFWANLPTDWPFATPEVFPAIDGNTSTLPAGWRANRGAYGCLQSHLKLVKEITEPTLILEDDAFFVADFASKVKDFLGRVPDWDALFLGGEHIQTPPFVDVGIVQCRNTQRTSAYVMTARMRAELSARWTTARSHCDHYLGPLCQRYKVYAPMPFLSGQAAGVSDIGAGWYDQRLWSNDFKEVLVYTETKLPMYHYGNDNDLKAALLAADKIGKIRSFLQREIGKKGFAITGVDWELVQQAYQPVQKERPEQ